jgi:hypothetical protein
MMRETIYLVLTRHKVERMTKRMPDTGRGEMVVRVNVKVEDTAFREPTLVREIVITDPMDGMQLPDVELTQPFITPEEAEILRQRRRRAMADILREQGYTVLAPQPEENNVHDKAREGDDGVSS